MSQFLEFIKNNYLHAVPIVFIGTLATAIVIERTRALIWIYPMKNIIRFFEKIRDQVMLDRIADALSLCEHYQSKLVAQVVKEALLRVNQPESMILDGLQIAVSEAIQKVQKRTSFLSMMANVSTLLGLLGTVVGLVTSFEAVGSISLQQRSSQLATGISTAMNATLLGLGVAIPCMIAFSFLMNRTNRLNVEIDQSAIRILDILKQRYITAEAEVTQEIHSKSSRA